MSDRLHTLQDEFRRDAEVLEYSLKTMRALRLLGIVEI